MQSYYLKNESGDVINKISINYNFRNQLWMALKCASISESQLENLGYYKKSLKNIFTKYNTCANSNFKDYDKKPKKDLFNLTIRPGLNRSSLNVNNVREFRTEQNIDFGTKTSFRFGIELEAVLPSICALSLPLAPPCPPSPPAMWIFAPFPCSFVRPTSKTPPTLERAP